MTSSLSNALRRIRGILFFFFMTTNMISIYILLFLWLITMPIPHRGFQQLRRRYCAWLNNVYFMGNAALISLIGQTKIIIHGDNNSFLHDEKVLVLSNHRTTVDWMYSGWCYAACLNTYPCLNFILKESLKLVPFFGWCMQMVVYLFLSRKREQDLPRIKRVLEYLKRVEATPSLFLFPEGTDLSRSNVKKSLEYAKSNNLQPMQYVMFPKAGGLHTVMDLVRAKNMVVHDITLGYVDYVHGQRTSEVSLLKGHFPSEMHMWVDRYDVNDIPESEEDLKKWLTQTYRDKDFLLAQFYESTIPGHKSEFIDVDEVKKSANPDPIYRKRLNPNILFTSNDVSYLNRRILPLVFMNVLSYIFMLSFYNYAMVRWFFLSYCLLFVASPWHGGIEMYELFFSEKIFNKK